jgi:hypothetical protein
MKNFTIYPNPADQFMQVLTNHGYPINEIRVYNMEGAVAMVVKNPKTTPISIATHGLSNGLYLVQIITNDQIETRKIVVTH